MDVKVFWSVIGFYNKNTFYIQFIFLALILLSVILACFKKVLWLPKISLGIANLFIATVFFGVYGTEAIQKFFAMPLFAAIGIVFIFEGVKNHSDSFSKIKMIQILLFVLIILYPVFSFMLGSRFPEITLYIMPCPLISLSILIYSLYQNKNKLLLLLLSIWGITGVKAFIFNALEDAVLFICGIYALYLFIKECSKTKI